MRKPKNTRGGGRTIRSNDWERRKIESDGWQRNFDNLTFKLEVGMDPVTIILEKGVRIRGRILDPDG